MTLEVIHNMINPSALLLIVLGVSLGILFGAIPGLSSTTGVALLLPFTYTMDTIPALLLMLSVYFGGMSGGLIPAILLRIPGTPASVATTFDGYPMAQKGRASKALGTGISASLFGGVFSAMALILFSPLLSKFALSFGPFEYFGITFFALMVVSSIMEGKMMKGFASLAIGLLMSCIGTSPIDGVKRFQMGFAVMSGGFQLMSLVIGVFAVAEMFNSVKMVGSGAVNISSEEVRKNDFYMTLHEWRCNLGGLLRSSLIGTLAGILPGLGGAAGSMMSYVQAKKTSKNPETFGTGCMEGVIASEAANNAVTGGALIPLLSLGVPGDAATALLMGALTVQGIQIGPGLFKTNPELVSTALSASLLINVILFFVAVVALKLFINIIKIPKYYLIPIIIVFCAIGCYTVNSRMFDVYVMFAFGYIGYILDKNGYSLTALILGFILGTTSEQYLRRALIYFGSFGKAMQGSKFGAAFVVLGVMYPIGSLLRQRMQRKKAAGGEGIEKKEENG